MQLLHKIIKITIFLLCLNSLIFGQAVTNEYNYIYEENITIGLEDRENKLVSLIIERRGLPLANRLVRFYSPNDDVLTFENGEKEVVIPTDDDGKVSLYLEPKRIGDAVVVMQMLYVSSSGNTNISQEMFSKVSVITAVDKETVTEKKISVLLPIILTPYIFISALIMYLINYYKRFTKEERSLYGHITLGTLFGFTSIRVHFKSMLILAAIELSILVLLLNNVSYIVPMILIALSISSFFKKRDRVYSIVFLLFSFLSLFYNITTSFISHSSILIMDDSNALMRNYIFIFLFFFIITAFFSGLFIPSMILTLYSTLALLKLDSIIIAVVAMYIASILYIIKVKTNKDLYFLYTINLLKTRQ